MRDKEFWAIVQKMKETRMDQLNMPDVTPAQVLSYALAAVALVGLVVLVALDAQLSAATVAVLGAPVVAVTGAVPLADARIREARNATAQTMMVEETARMQSEGPDVDLG